MDEDILASGRDIGDTAAELEDPINSNPPQAPALKRLHVGVVGQANPITFVLPAVKSISSSSACTSSYASPRVLILNDSFHKMLDFKAKHNQFPSTYEDMVAFLSEVRF
jgi:hypothetical protein